MLKKSELWPQSIEHQVNYSINHYDKETIMKKLEEAQKRRESLEQSQHERLRQKDKLVELDKKRKSEMAGGSHCEE
jgi:ppGpp synthetase/RelA/SpoT-type nucleotidyltranferase